MKILIIFLGESYRYGILRSRGINDYIRHQMLASISHIKLINILKSQGYDIDVILNTYKLNDRDDKNLLEYYQKNTNVINSFFYDEIFENEIKFYENVICNIIPKKLNNNYDFVLFVRIDLYLKKFLLETIKLIPDKILFLHIDSFLNQNGHDINYSNKTNKHQINYIIFTISKKNFHIFTDDTLKDKSSQLNKFIHLHFIRYNLIDAGIPMDDIIYMTNTLHVCNTLSGWNPFYIIVGRPYNNQYNKFCDYCSTIEHYYDTETHQLIHDVSKTTERWKDHLNIDTLEQNLAELQENSFEELLSK